MTTGAESSVVHYGRTAIPYRIRRSARRKTVAVSVAAGEGVTLSAPLGTPVERLDRVVHAKATWIVERLRHVGQVEDRVPERELVSGESYLYLGRHYRLSVAVAAAAQPGPVRLERGWLRVELPRAAAGEHRAALIRRGLVGWYKRHAQARLPERVAAWHARLGVAMPAVLIREQSKRWGSCDDHGTLRINWRIIQAPLRLVDYVAVHELAHLVHRDHTRAYWALVGTAMPDYEARKEQLRILGPRLTW